MLDVRAANIACKQVLKVGSVNAQGAGLSTIAKNIWQQIQINGIQPSEHS